MTVKSQFYINGFYFLNLKISITYAAYSNLFSFIYFILFFAGINEDDQMKMFGVVSAILHLGNILLEPGEDESTCNVSKVSSLYHF